MSWDDDDDDDDYDGVDSRWEEAFRIRCNLRVVVVVVVIVIMVDES